MLYLIQITQQITTKHISDFSIANCVYFDFAIFSVQIRVINTGDVIDLRELYTAHNGEGEVPVQDGHEAGDAEEEQHGGGADSGGCNLRHRQMRCLRDGNGGDRLHRLDRHRRTEENSGGYVVEGGEDECGGEIEVGDEREGQHYGDVGAEVADGAAELGEEGGLEAEGSRDAVAPSVEVVARGGGFRRVVGHAV